MGVIDLVDVKKSYRVKDGKLEVLKGVTFSVEEGDFVFIMGPSGVGKSTLLHILGLLDLPTEGTVKVEGRRVPEDERIRAVLRNRLIGFVFQFHYLLPEFTALENVAIPCLVGGMPEDEAFDRAYDVLSKVGLADRVSHRPSELSGGEQQRVALARALVKEPKVVIADEPTGNLDKRTGAGIAELMAQVNAEKKVAFVVATHDEELASIGGKIYFMRDGILLEEGDYAGS